MLWSVALPDSVVTVQIDSVPHAPAERLVEGCWTQMMLRNDLSLNLRTPDACPIALRP